MNERIRELYDQIAGDNKLGFDSYLAEKFAELIVRECANRCLSDDSMRILNHMGMKGVE